MFSARTRVRRTRYRTTQFLRYLHWRGGGEVDAALKSLLSPAEWELARRMPLADRRHALAVHSALVQSGHDDPDLLAAALLHDAGKQDEYGRVSVVHRVVKVLLHAGSPRLLERVASKRSGWLRHGLYLAVHHPSIGAALARGAGASERTCWLIAHHHDDTISDDADLDVLRLVDERE